MPIKHAFVSGYADSTDKTLVKPSDWNADHVGTTLDLQVNGTSNQSQTLLNLAQANGVVIQDQGNGNVQLSVGTITENQVANLPADLASKAPIASPALTGTPTAPTPTAGNNSTSIATTAFVDAAIAAGGGLPTAPEPANTVLAGPASGASAAPTFRALVANDIPSDPNPLNPGYFRGDGAHWTLTADLNGAAYGIRILSTDGAYPILFGGASADWVIGPSAGAVFTIGELGGPSALTVHSGTHVVDMPFGGTSTTPTAGDNSTKLATTAFVQQVATGGTKVLTSDYTATAADNGMLLAFNNPSNATLSLPSTVPFPTWHIFTENTAGANVTVASPGAPMLDGSIQTILLKKNQGCYITTDGTNYYTEQGTSTGGGSGGGGGTVTSVGLTMPAEFAVAGSPITTFGTLAVAKASQAANQVYAGPASAGAGGLVQSASANSTSGSVTAAFPSPNTAGNLLVAFGVAYGISNPTDTAGNTWVDSGLAPNNGINGRMWYVASCKAGANSVIFSGGRAAQLHIYEISGQALSAVLDQSSSNQSNSGTAFSVTTSGAVSQAAEIVLACFSSNSSSTTSMTAGTGYTQEQSTFDSSTASGNVITTSQIGNVTSGLSGPQIATATGNAASSYWFAMIGTFKLASGGPGAPVFRALVAADIPPIPESGVIGLTSDLAAKAPLASPALTGAPTAPTPVTADNTTKIATTAFVQSAIASIGGTPSSAAANTVFAGPTTGASAAPTFRALVANDIPGTLNPIKIGTAGSQPVSILIGNASTNPGSTQFTQFGTDPTQGANGVFCSILGVADQGYKWLLVLDGGGNVGITGIINANGGVFNGTVTANGTVLLNGSSLITGPPPVASGNAGWKLAMYDDKYAIGIAPYSMMLKSDFWLSVSNAIPAGDATASTPDSTAATTMGSNGVFYSGAHAGVTAGPFTSIGNIQVTGGLVTALAGSSTEPANTVLAGPTTGAAAAPTFRALVAADIPGTLNMTTFPGTGASGTQATVTINPPASGTGAALNVVGPGTGSTAALFISNGTNGGYSLQIGAAGNAQPEPIMIANASVGAGSLKFTQIATGVTTLVNGIGGPGAILGIADTGYKWMFNLDGGGNLGILGGLYATTLQLNPTTGATGIQLTGTVNMQIHITDTATTPNYVQMALSEIIGNYFTDAAVGDGILRTQNNLRLGKAGSPSALVIQANFVEFPGAITITAAPPTVSNNSGWKIGLFGNTYAIGVAAGTTIMRVGNWLSVFGPTLPAANGSASAPDTNAMTSMGVDGTFWSGTSKGVTQATSITGSSITAMQTKGGLVTLLTSSSDERLKAIVGPYEGGLDAVLKINPVYFRWNEEGVRYTQYSGDRVFLGFTAQNAQAAIPECVPPGTEGDRYLSFDDKPIMAALVSAVKTLAAKVKELEAKLNEKRN